MPKWSATPLPLLIFLHGSGSCGYDNLKQLRGLPEQLSRPEWQTRCPGFVVVPQCPDQSHWSQELPALLKLIERWRNDPRVDKQRIYVTGVSMGGYGTWSLVAAKPAWIAAAVPVCGGGDPKTAEAIRPVPIWAIHGDADEIVSVENSRKMIDALRFVGASPRYTELKGVGHDSWTQAYEGSLEVLTWLYLQTNHRCIECQ